MITDILARFRDCPDREHEMSLNRLVFLAVITTYTFYINPTVPSGVLVSGVIFAVVSLGVAVHLLVRPNPSTTRRVVAVISDLVTTSVQIHYVGETSSVLFLLYLWITFGNGFRFGLRFLYIAMAVSVICFTVVIYVTPRWHDDLYLSASLLLSLIVLPLYASTLIRKLSNAKAQAEAANRAKTLFLASVSHELRTPLNAIIGLSSLIAETPLSSEQRGMIGTIQSAGESLLRQINSILNLSRIEAGKMPIERVDFDLAEVLSTARAMVLSQAQTKGLRITIHIAPQTPLTLHGPKHHVEEVLLNLLGNAVKFTEKGFVTLAAHAEVTSAGASVRFVVSDTGIGIAPTAIDRIFESFTQADETIINRFGGSGLGLSICRQLISAMGGEIGVVSREGHGSSFWFDLPLDVVDQDGSSRLLSGSPQPVLVCSQANFGQIEQFIRTQADDMPIVHSLSELKEWVAKERVERVIPLYYSEAPESTLSAELEKAELPMVPVLIRPSPLQDLTSSELIHFTSSILTPGSSQHECQVALIAASAQTAWAQATWNGPTVIEIPVASIPLKILVADDNATNRMVIAKILERGGHAAICVTDGDQALAALEGGDFDLVIMDVNMPVMTGLEAAKLFRFTEPSGTHLPIIALTADVTPEVVSEAHDAGIDACLTKPVQPITLLRTIEEHVSARSSVAKPANAMASGPGSDAISVIDESVLAELENLGGSDFVRTLVSEFFSDVDHLVDELRQAVVSGDAHRFRAEAHGLQSASANVGAKSVHEICIGWRKITNAELSSNGGVQLERLLHALELTRNSLDSYLSHGKRTLASIH